MSELSGLFQWERFITPSIIKIFYWLVVGISVLAGAMGIVGGAVAIFSSPISGVISIVSSLFGMLVGIIFARISTEMVLIVFRINEHLGAIRNNQRGM